MIRRSEKLDSEWMMNWKLQLLNSDIWKINKFVIKIRNTTFWLVRNLKGQLHAEALIDPASFWSLQPTCAVHCDATEWTHIAYTEESPDWNCWWVNELKIDEEKQKDGVEPEEVCLVYRYKQILLRVPWTILLSISCQLNSCIMVLEKAVSQKDKLLTLVPSR